MGRRWKNNEEEYLKKNYNKKTAKEIAKNLDRSWKSIIRKTEALDIGKSHLEKMKETIRETEEEKYEEEPINYFIAGYVAGEGCFTKSFTNKKTPYFRFSLGVTVVDKQLIKLCKEKIKAGHVKFYKVKNEKWANQCILAIQSQIEIKRNLIPFMDKFLLTSHKKEQYSKWKKEFREKYSI